MPNIKTSKFQCSKLKKYCTLSFILYYIGILSFTSTPFFFGASWALTSAQLNSKLAAAKELLSVSRVWFSGKGSWSDRWLTRLRHRLSRGVASQKRFSFKNGTLSRHQSGVRPFKVLHFRPFFSLLEFHERELLILELKTQAFELASTPVATYFPASIDTFLLLFNCNAFLLYNSGPLKVGRSHSDLYFFSHELLIRRKLTFV